MSEAQEAELRSQLILMWSRNPGKPYIMKRVFKRFMSCLTAGKIK
jgi:hypothetical protein